MRRCSHAGVVVVFVTVAALVVAAATFGGANIAQFIDQPRQNRGRLECWEEWVPYSAAALWMGDLPQAKAMSTDATATASTRTAGQATLRGLGILLGNVHMNR